MQSLSPVIQFALAIGLGYGALWLMLWCQHQGHLMSTKREYDAHVGVRHEALFLAVVLSLTWCLMASFTPVADPGMPLRVAGGASGVWLACGTVLMLSVQWWRQRRIWKVR